MVVHIITSLGVGGAETMLSKVVLGRKKKKMNDIVICLTRQDKIGDFLEQNDIKVYYLDMKSFWNSLASIRKLNKLLNLYQPSIVQTWLYHADLIGGIICKFKGIKVCWNIRQTKFTSSKSLITIIVMRICALLSYIIPSKIICAANASLLSHKRFGYSKKKMKVIPNGFLINDPIDPSILQATKANYFIQTKDVVIGTVGRFHNDKDYLTFIKAARLVINVYPSVKFIMVGKNLNSKNKLLITWLIKEQCLRNFILVGETTEVNLYLSLIDIFCLSSISEGFPNVVGEAMLQAKPCVVTDSGDSRFIVGDTGLVAEVKNATDLSNKLKEMIELGAEERFKLGIKAKERIKQNFMLEDIVNEYSKTYEEILK